MKGIYKKISVGVLAAALLVGGSGILKGGQAFAYSPFRYQSEEQLRAHLEECEKEDERKGLGGLFVGYNRWSDRRQALYVSKYENLEVSEVDKLSSVDKKYDKGWDVRDDKENVAKQVNLKGQFKAKVGDLYFIFSK